MARQRELGSTTNTISSAGVVLVIGNSGRQRRRLFRRFLFVASASATAFNAALRLNGQWAIGFKWCWSGRGCGRQIGFLW